MLWLKRLAASKMKPVGAPDFEIAPWHTVELSGTEVRFKTPQDTIGLFLDNWPTQFNLYGDNYDQWPDGKGMVQTLFKSGWSYCDHLIWGEGHIGGLRIYINIQRRHPHNRSIESMFKPEDARKWITDCLNDSYKDSERNWDYPKTPSEVETVTFNQTSFYSVRRSDLPHTWKHYYQLPVSDDHMLMFLFLPSSLDKHLVNDFDNVEAEAEKTMQSFMQNVHIRLSDDALRCQTAF